jgi:hypothetical protein
MEVCQSCGEKLCVFCGCCHSEGCEDRVKTLEELSQRIQSRVDEKIALVRTAVEEKRRESEQVG